MDTVKAATNRTEAMLVLYEATYTQHFFVLFCAAICIQPKQPRKGRRRCWFCRRLPKHFLLCFAQQYGYSQSSHEMDGGDAGFVGGYSTLWWAARDQDKDGACLSAWVWACMNLYLCVSDGLSGINTRMVLLVCVGVGVCAFSLLYS